MCLCTCSGICSNLRTCLPSGLTLVTCVPISQNQKFETRNVWSMVFSIFWWNLKFWKNGWRWCYFDGFEQNFIDFWSFFFNRIRWLRASSWDPWTLHAFPPRRRCCKNDTWAIILNFQFWMIQDKIMWISNEIWLKMLNFETNLIGGKPENLNYFEVVYVRYRELIFDFKLLIIIKIS